MARTGIQETIQRIQRQLRTNIRDEIATLAVALDTTPGLATLSFLEALPAQLVAGSIVSIDCEEMRVVDVDRTARTFRVSRAWADSPIEEHAQYAPVWVNSRYSRHVILDEMINEIQSWGNELYDVRTTEVPVESGVEILEMPAEFASAYHLIYVRVNSSRSPAWRDVRGRTQFANVSDWSASTDSGILFRAYEPFPTGTALIAAALPFDASSITLTSDLVTDLRMAPTMVEILDLGVKARILYDAANNDAQRQNVDEVQSRQDVPVASSTRLAANMRALQRARIEVESRRLRSRYPVMVGFA